MDEPTPEVLSAPAAVSDEEARAALKEFFAGVLEKDGREELLRIAECFLDHAKRKDQGKPRCWADRSDDGNLKAPEVQKVKKAKNSQ